MSDTWNDEDLDDILGNAGDNSTIKILREKIKADNAAIREMRGELDSLRNQNRGNLVEGALKSAGFKTGAASLYTGEADPTAIQAWVDANKDFLARDEGQVAPIAQGNTIEPQIPTGTPAAPVTFTSDAQMQYQRMLSAGVDGMPGSNYTEAMGGMNAANNLAELMAVIAQHS